MGLNARIRAEGQSKFGLDYLAFWRLSRSSLRLDRENTAESDFVGASTHPGCRDEEFQAFGFAFSRIEVSGFGLRLEAPLKRGALRLLIRTGTNPF